MPYNTRIGSLEERIRALCRKVTESADDEDLQRMCAELRTLVREHIELMREQVRQITAREKRFHQNRKK